MRFWRRKENNSENRRPFWLVFLLVVCLVGGVSFFSYKSYSFFCPSGPMWCSLDTESSNVVQEHSRTRSHQVREFAVTIAHLLAEFIVHEFFLEEVVFDLWIAPAMMMMTEQMTAVAMHQAVAIGAFLGIWITKKMNFDKILSGTYSPKKPKREKWNAWA